MYVFVETSILTIMFVLCVCVFEGDNFPKCADSLNSLVFLSKEFLRQFFWLSFASAYTFEYIIYYIV
ncbi:hypothetical protein EB796_013664 [Bugula neritina]|uniref:Uncharacterized protein n=1 Tax=Bugula neritina TaxID=10212 RepID=A0A7J7JPV1_BUGNE|nr:hypothetical protein EB796_013664 [Bugula neritina]